MFVPLNLSQEEVERLRLTSAISQSDYYLETIFPFDKLPKITYVSPISDICLEKLTRAEYLKCSTSEGQLLLKSLMDAIRKCRYEVVLFILDFARELLNGEIKDSEWRFIEKVVEFCIYIKSPEITLRIEQMLREVLAIRNVVIYISDSQDAHFTMHLDPMNREFIFISVDLLLSLYSSPQGYPIPSENVFLLFELATFIWYRKPSGLPRGNAPLEKLTRQDILEFVDSLRVKYANKLFPQSTIEDQKIVYFEVIAEELKSVKVCDSHFENSTYFWKTGDFIKPLGMQAARRSDWSIDQAFSPFIYDDE